jgi:hypothetical protein
MERTFDGKTNRSILRHVEKKRQTVPQQRQHKADEDTYSFITIRPIYVISLTNFNVQFFIQ